VEEAGSEFDEDVQILDEDPTKKKDEGTGSSASRGNYLPSRLNIYNKVYQVYINICNC
jgi:hypothetical protein